MLRPRFGCARASMIVAAYDRSNPDNGRKYTVPLRRLIPTGINQNLCAHFRRPMDMIFQG
jgi:hypothetical protein